jgi:membrane-bound lytic murein transglycosylase B
MKKLLPIFISLLVLVLTGCTEDMLRAQAFDHKKTAFINQMATQYGFSRSYVAELLANANYVPHVVSDATDNFEKSRWYRYERIFMTDKRIDAGCQYWQNHTFTLNRSETIYGVDPIIIVSILGVETFYGTKQGDDNILDALSSLAFSDLPRASYFRDELTQFLLLTREMKIDPRNVHGSWAGALGFPQFMPSSYRKLAIGTTNRYPDLFNDTDDVPISVANYFAKVGWQKNGMIAIPATVSGNVDNLINNQFQPIYTVGFLKQQGVRPSQNLDDTTKVNLIKLEIADGQYQYWLTLPNFYVITKYNSSINYAMAVFELSNRIREKCVTPSTDISAILM